VILWFALLCGVVNHDFFVGRSCVHISASQCW
jgi:hypothetical protein